MGTPMANSLITVEVNVSTSTYIRFKLSALIPKDFVGWAYERR